MLHFFKFRSNLPGPVAARESYAKPRKGRGWPEQCPPLRAANAFGWDVPAAFEMVFKKRRDGSWRLENEVEVASDWAWSPRGGKPEDARPLTQRNAWFWDENQTIPHVITPNVYEKIRNQVKVSTFLYLGTDENELVLITDLPNQRRPFRAFSALVETDRYPASYPWHCVLELDPDAREVRIAKGEPICRLVLLRRDRYAAAEMSLAEFDAFFDRGQRWLARHGKGARSEMMDITGAYGRLQKEGPVHGEAADFPIVDPRHSDSVTEDSKPTPDAARENQAGAFLKPALAKIKANLELLLGRAVGVVASDPSSLAGVEVMTRLSGPFVALGVQASGAVEGQIHCVVGQPLMLAMTCIAQLKSEQAITERLGQAPELSATERDGAKEVGSFITAALGDFAKESTGERIVLAPIDPRFCPGDEAPKFGDADDWAVIEATVEVAPAPAASMLLIVPSTVAKAWKAPEPAPVFGGKAEGPAAAPEKHTGPVSKPATTADVTPSAWVAGTEAFVTSIQDAAGDALAVQGMPSLAQMLSAGESEAGPALVVVEIASGAEFQLDMVAALRHHPTFASSALVVALEDANRRHVVRCGSLGILDVVPVDLDPKILGERLLSRIGHAPGASKRS